MIKIIHQKSQQPQRSGLFFAYYITFRKRSIFRKKDFSKEISCSVLVAVVDQNWKFFQLYILTIKNTFISI